MRYVFEVMSQIQQNDKSYRKYPKIVLLELPQKSYHRTVPSWKLFAFRNLHIKH